MNPDLGILILEAMSVYLLVLGVHSLRHRVGLGPFYALLGGITAVMSWVTDAGVQVEIVGITFMIGSTVFYTSLLLGVFVVYVFDGPQSTRVAILTVAGVSVMMPVIAFILHMQMQISGAGSIPRIPVPSLRVNAASVCATILDLVFLAVAWEFLGKPRLRLRMWLRTFLVLLGVMWLDVFLFATGAFAGTPLYLSIMSGTLSSRFIISVFATPFLYLYLNWENKKEGVVIERRPVLAILREMAEVREELGLARQEIERRKKAEAEKAKVIEDLQAALARVRKLEGLLPVCASCKRIRVDSPDPETPPRWVSLEEYVQKETSVQFSHGVCADCFGHLYPELSDMKQEKKHRE